MKKDGAFTMANNIKNKKTTKMSYKRKGKGNRLLIMTLIVALLAGVLTSCSMMKTNPMTSTDLDKTIVGTVGDYEVRYDELSYIAYEFRDSMEKKYGEGIWNDHESAEKYRAELEENVFEAIKSNYAVLALCAQNGYKDALKKYEIKKDVDSYIYSMLERTYAGISSNNQNNNGANDSAGAAGDGAETSADNNDAEAETGVELKGEKLRMAYAQYEKDLREQGMNDYVFRLYMGVYFAEQKLLSMLEEDGRLPYSDDDVWEVMQSEDFIHTDHIYIKCSSAEEFEEKRAIAEEVRDGLRSGKTIAYYIKNGTDSDFLRKSTAGYYFLKGEMVDEYEEAAFALNIDEVSDVVRTDSGYYIIKRLAKDDTFMNVHLSEYTEQIRYSRYKVMLNECEETLTFVPNEYGKTLDVTKIMPDKTLTYAYAPSSDTKSGK